MDTASPEYLMQCLARHVCALGRKDRDEGRAFIERYQKRHGKAAADKLKAAINEEWRKQSNE